MKPWYRFENNASEPTVAEIYIYGEIGDPFSAAGVTAKAFVDQLGQLAAGVRAIRLRVNSQGGDAFMGLAIANALREQHTAKGRTVEAIIDGLAASAASVAAMGAQTIVMAENALMVVHNAWMLIIGNADEMRDQAAALEKIDAAIVTTYQWHSRLSAGQIAALMDATTWMDADEAITNGFATEKRTGLQAAASLRPEALAKLTVPAAYRARVDALIAPAATELEIVRACGAAGNMALADALIGAGLSLAEVHARIEARRAAAAARATSIRQLCELAEYPALADGFIRSAMTEDDVQGHLVLVLRNEQRAYDDKGVVRPAPIMNSLAPVSIADVLNALAKPFTPDIQRRVHALMRAGGQAAPGAPLFPPAASIAQVLAACETADCLELVRPLVDEGATLEQVQARAQAARDVKAAAAVRVSTIRAVCKMARLPELADSFVSSGIPERQVREQLVILSAKLDTVEIDTHLDPDTGTRKAVDRFGIFGKGKPQTSAEIYAERNRS